MRTVVVSGRPPPGAAWTMVTVVFSLAFRASSSFGVVYGPLAGVVALQLWTFASSAALFFGAAVSAQLEAVRTTG